jgi:hypothetical protein
MITFSLLPCVRLLDQFIIAKFLIKQNNKWSSYFFLFFTNEHSENFFHAMNPASSIRIKVGVEVRIGGFGLGRKINSATGSKEGVKEVVAPRMVVVCGRKRRVATPPLIAWWMRHVGPGQWWGADAVLVSINDSHMGGENNSDAWHRWSRER